MYHGVGEEHHVHPCSSYALIVLAEEHVQTLGQGLQGLDGLVHFGQVEVCVFRLLAWGRKAECLQQGVRWLSG